MPDPSARSLQNIYQVKLGRFFADYEFSIDIKSQLVPLVLSSIVIYYRVFINFLPTPNKSHYIFNLRDLSKLHSGLMQASPSVILTKENLVDLFAHESIRVFDDRLISQDDHALFEQHLSDTVNDYFRVNIKSKLSGQANNLNNSKSKDEEANEKDRVKNNAFLYGDFMKNEDRIYHQLSNWKQIVSALSEYQMRLNMSGGHATKQIVFFREAVEHICKACRILRQQGGHMLVIGIDGTGKNTIVELAAFISNCEMFKLNLKKGYVYSDFRDDIKRVFKLTGIQKKKIVFFVADKDINNVRN
jgi:dynein heavy chain